MRQILLLAVALIACLSAKAYDYPYLTFVGADNADYNDYCSEDFVGISPNGDGEFDNLRGIITPLRQLGNRHIMDSDRCA